MNIWVRKCCSAWHDIIHTHYKTIFCVFSSSLLLVLLLLISSIPCKCSIFSTSMFSYISVCSLSTATYRYSFICVSKKVGRKRKSETLTVLAAHKHGLPQNPTPFSTKDVPCMSYLSTAFYSKHLSTVGCDRAEPKV